MLIINWLNFKSPILSNNHQIKRCIESWVFLANVQIKNKKIKLRREKLL